MFPSAQDAVQTIRELRSIGLPENLENGPPPKVPNLLRRLNNDIRKLVVEILNDPGRHGIPREEEVTDQLRAAGWEEILDHKWNAYGEILDIHFDFKPGYEPGVLLVSTQLWIPCGSSDPDSAVYVFTGRARRWELVLVADADFNSLGPDAGSGFRLQLSPPDDSGKWYLAIAHTPPSCRDAQPYLRYSILRPGPSPDSPITLLNKRETIETKFDPPFEARTEEDWFAVTRGRRRKLDDEWGISIARYEIKGRQVTRIHPLAILPEDFLDEWVQLNWNDSARWVKEPKSESVQNWHSLLNSLEPDSAEMRIVQHCPIKQGRDDAWIIQLWIDQQMNPGVKEENLFIEISKDLGIFYVDRIQTTRSAGCPGNGHPFVLSDWKLPSW